MKNLAAFTENITAYPAYISINEHAHDAGNNISISVRNPPSSLGVCGSDARIVMSKADFRQLLITLNNNFAHE